MVAKMNTEIIVALISGAVTVVTVIIANISGNRAVAAKLEKQQAVTDTKLDMLAAEVKKHNDFGRRIPVIEEQIKVANHRIDDLERKTDKI